MKARFFSMLLIVMTLLMPQTLKAQSSNPIILGNTDATSSDYPFCNYYRGSWSQSVYAPWEIGQSGYITEVAYNCAYADTITFADLRIYMGVTYDTLMEDASAYLPMSGLTLVYSATNVLMGTHTGWYPFALQSPFYYDAAAGAHLVIVVAKYSPRYTSQLEFYYDYSEYSRTIFRQCDDEDRYCAQHPTPYDSYYWGNYRPQTRLTMATSAGSLCAAPSAISTSSITAHSAVVQWTAAEGTSEWELVYGPVGFLPDSTGADITHIASLTSTSYTLANLMADNTYDIYVRTACSATQHSGWRSIQIHTSCDYMAEFPYVEDFESYGSNGLPSCWERRIGHLQGTTIIGWNPRSGDWALMFSANEADSVQIVTLPPMQRLDTLQLSFFAAAEGASSLQVGVMEGETFILVQDVTSQLGTDDYSIQSIDVDFSSYHGSGTLIALRALHRSTYAAVYVDDLLVSGRANAPSRRAFNITMDSINDAFGTMYAYTNNPYHYYGCGQTAQIDSGATLYIRVISHDDVMIDSSTINGIPFLPIRTAVDTIVEVVVTSNLHIRATFAASLPDLHVVALSHSPLTAGHDATISWTVRNDGAAPTPNGVVWYDRLWLSMECRVATNDDKPTFLGEFPNIRVLNPGESYTQTQTVHIPNGLDGDKYLFAIADAHDCYSILWLDSNIAPIPCPAASGQFLVGMAAHCTGEYCQNYSGSNVNEYLELTHNNAYHDNFFYDTVHIHTGENPDIQALNIIHPSIIYSGTNPHIYATVTNAGSRRSQFRQDELFISNSPTFDSSAVWIAHAQFTIPVFTSANSQEPIRVAYYGMGSMNPNETQIDTFWCKLPDHIYGTAYFYLVLDAQDDNYEHAGEDNNVFRSDPVDVLLTPYPDLTPRDITVPDAISTGDSLSISYTILNQGPGTSHASRWTNRFYLSAYGGGITGQAIEIGAHENLWYPGSIVLNPDESRTNRLQLMLPSSLDSGYYYLYVSVDDDNDVFEYQYEDNNILRTPERIHVAKPDLIVTQVMAEDTLTTGLANRMAYTLLNQGQGEVDKIRRNDLVTLARNADGSGEVYQCNINKTLSLQSDRTLTEEVEITPDRNIPQGSYYLFVTANSTSEINELDLGNNSSTGIPVFLKRQLLPDLQVANLQHSANLQAGAETHVAFSITNNGTVGMNANLSFSVSVTNGTDTLICPTSTCTPSTLGVNIPQGGSQQFDCNVLISPSANGSYSQLLVEVDPRNEIREECDTNNLATSSVAITPYPFDLAVQSFSAASSAETGDSITLTFTVINQGTVPNSALPLFINSYGTMVDAAEYQDEDHPSYSTRPLWRDGFYLSTDSQWDSADIYLGHAWNYHYLTHNDTYTDTLRLQMPYRSWGSLFLVMKADDELNTFDNSRSNNISSAPIQVGLGLTPDLKITQMSFRRANVERSQSHMFYYTVQNQGLGATPQNEWIDRFYMAAHPSTDDDNLAGYRHHIGRLLPGESYSDSIEIEVPRFDIGTYTVTGLTDATDQVFEHTGEGNNIDTMSIYVTLGPIVDLIPSQPSFDETILLDRLGINISYPLLNAGPNFASGRVKELVYLSLDNQWDNEDILISTTTPLIGIPSGQSELMRIHSEGSGVTPGYYYVIVRSNALNALNESSYANNTVVSSSRVYIDYPSVVIGEPYLEDHVAKADRYFRIDVLDDQVGQTLLCHVEGVHLESMSLSHGTAPTATHFEFYTSAPSTAGTTEYELMVPSLKAGTYYLRINMGNVTSNYSTLDIEASIVDFDIISVDAARGANSGSLTTHIRGAKFDTIMDFRLQQNGLYIPASKVHVKNSTDAYTTFDLTDLAPGQYDVVAELQGGYIVTKSGAFVIEQGLPANLNGRIEGPSTVRIGVMFQATVEYSNTGMTDVPVEGLMVISRNGQPISSTTQGLSEQATRLFIPIAETDGNPGVLRPGFSGSKTIFVYPNSSNEVILDLYTVKRAQ